MTGCPARSVISHADNALDVEKLRLESKLIIQSIQTGDPEDAKKNLSFLISAGLVNDRDGKIAKAIADLSATPVLPVTWKSLGGMTWNDSAFGLSRFGSGRFGREVLDEEIQARIDELQAEEKRLNEELERRSQGPK